MTIVAGECVNHLATVNRRINAFEVYGLPLLEYNSSVWPSSLKYLIELLIIVIIEIIYCKICYVDKNI